MRTIITLGAAVAILVSATHASASSPFITIEAVNDYSACNGGSLPNSIADAIGFRAGMTSGVGTIFSPGITWLDSNVWPSDFYDPQRTGLADDDSTNFDRGGDAISYFAGHGVCDTGNSGQYCASGSDCTSPMAGTSYPAFCRRLPGDNFGNCSYTKMNRELAVGNCTSGAGASARGGRVNYSSGNVRWGESPTSGSWGGAGSLGGTNAVVLHSSCAELSWRGQEIWPAFAGVHLIATVLVHTGDTANISTRGANFAQQYQFNKYSSVADGWTDGMNSNPDRNDYCRNFFGNQVFGGGYGVNGCGGHVVTALGATSSEAVGHLGENWYAIQDDANDGKGNGYWASDLNCNYDCWTYPFGV